MSWWTDHYWAIASREARHAREWREILLGRRHPAYEWNLIHAAWRYGDCIRACKEAGHALREHRELERAEKLEAAR